MLPSSRAQYRKGRKIRNKRFEICLRDKQKPQGRVQRTEEGKIWHRVCASCESFQIDGYAKRKENLRIKEICVVGVVSQVKLIHKVTDLLFFIYMKS